MKFISTRHQASSLPFSETLLHGIAPDGGLYVPESIPIFDLSHIKRIETKTSFSKFAVDILRPFLKGDLLEQSLESICQEAFNFPVTFFDLDSETSVLELFYGPTAAFKDFGARFLASCLSRLAQQRGISFHILVATSGDTGGAVASAFFQRPNTQVTVLFPKGRISSLQEKQITVWGENVSALAVNGSFDDCQRLVKEMLSDTNSKAKLALTSANSISLGRLLPQILYYASSSLEHCHRHGSEANYIIPSGNLGNAMGAFYARKMGFPLGKIVLVQNANCPLVDYLKNDVWATRPSIPTLANAMDVGNPSNMERLNHLFPTRKEVLSAFEAFSVSDAEIQESIRQGFSKWGQIWCPHTATAGWIRLDQKQGRWIIVATAHPSKFSETVEPLLGRKIPLPSSLAEIYSRPSHFQEIEPELKALQAKIGQTHSFF